MKVVFPQQFFAADFQRQRNLLRTPIRSRNSCIFSIVIARKGKERSQEISHTKTVEFLCVVPVIFVYPAAAFQFNFCCVAHLYCITLVPFGLSHLFCAFCVLIPIGTAKCARKRTVYKERHICVKLFSLSLRNKFCNQ
jgi:hypothetical protein